MSTTERMEVLQPHMENNTLPVDEFNQPVYRDAETLAAEIAILQEIGGITSLARIQGAACYLGAIARGESRLAVTISGDCDPVIGTDQDTVSRSAKKIQTQREISQEIFGPHVEFTRELSQSIKRRTSPWKQLPNGLVVPNHLGNGVNGSIESQQSKEPDPRLLTVMARHASLVMNALGSKTSGPFFTSHDLMSTVYENCFIETDEEGRKFISTGALLWLGYNASNRLRDSQGKLIPQLERLVGVENIPGMKIGPGNTKEYVVGATEALRKNNPDRPIIYMLRYGVSPSDKAEIREMIDTISTIPNALVVKDFHGTTKETLDKNGNPCKTRYIADCIDGVVFLGEECASKGVLFVGTNSETTDDPDYYECVDSTNRPPNGNAIVDPLFNPEQTYRIYEAALPYIKR